jgi:hypothetical protein
LSVSAERWTRAAILGLVGLLAGLAWLTGHPESPIVDRAVGWPGIGPLAVRFRDLYRPPQPAAPPAPEAGPSVEVVTIWLPSEEPPVGRAPEIPRAPSVGAPPDAEPPLGREPEPVLPLPARRADAERWTRAQILLGSRSRETVLGPYPLLLDSALDPAPLERWSALARALDATFALRTGCTPLGEPAESVVIFAGLEQYRAFQLEEGRIAALDTAGHASAGLAALWMDRRSLAEVEATLVHELAHLVVRRAVGPALPPWLDEGLAEDLAQTPFDLDSGRFELGALRSDFERIAGRVEVRGALAGLARVAAAEAGGSRTPLAELVALDWDRFVAGDAPLRYAESLFFLRWLFDGGDPAASAALRGFLAEVAQGEAADGARLLSRLGEPAALDAAFGAWLAAERYRRFAAAGLPRL